MQGLSEDYNLILKRQLVHYLNIPQGMRYVRVSLNTFRLRVRCLINPVNGENANPYVRHIEHERG